jgi:hypothetical protein
MVVGVGKSILLFDSFAYYCMMLFVLDVVDVVVVFVCCYNYHLALV